MKSFKITLSIIIAVAFVVFVQSFLMNAFTVVNPYFQNINKIPSVYTDCVGIKDKQENEECLIMRKEEIKNRDETVNVIRSQAIHGIIESIISLISVLMAVVVLKKLKFSSFLFGCEDDCKCNENSENKKKKSKK